MADVNLIWKDDEALLGAIPYRFIVVTKRVPRENTILIGQQQAVNAEVAAYGQRPVIVS